MVYTLECASSLTVAMTWPVRGSAVRPSHLPRMSHWRSGRPLPVNATTVLSRLPSGAAWPCGPTPFWNAVNRTGPSAVMSSGRLSFPVCQVFEPAFWKRCLS